MRFFVGVTDWDWWSLHAAQESVDEVNFWRPSPTVGFAALQPGELFLFKLHSPRNFISGGGFFSKFVSLPVSLAWEAFGLANGARSQTEVRARISQYRKTPIAIGEDPNIGCILLEEPFFWPEEDWIDTTPYFSLNIVSGKTFATGTELGDSLWLQVQERLVHVREREVDPGPSLLSVTQPDRYGTPQLVFPRLGQGSFRVLVTDAYQRRCAMTGEKTLPVLQAAHIRPYTQAGPHEISNGILLRSDLHTLFDRGYL
jgi:putative restriction endonuclease